MRYPVNHSQLHLVIGVYKFTKTCFFNTLRKSRLLKLLGIENTATEAIPVDTAIDSLIAEFDEKRSSVTSTNIKDELSSTWNVLEIALSTARNTIANTIF